MNESIIEKQEIESEVKTYEELEKMMRDAKWVFLGDEEEYTSRGMSFQHEGKYVEIIEAERRCLGSVTKTSIEVCEDDSIDVGWVYFGGQKDERAIWILGLDKGVYAISSKDGEKRFLVAKVPIESLRNFELKMRILEKRIRYCLCEGYSDWDLLLTYMTDCAVEYSKRSNPVYE